MKRQGILKPGVRFKEFWADLNFVERRRFAGQRMIPTRWILKEFRDAMRRVYTPDVVSRLVYVNNPFLRIMSAHNFQMDSLVQGIVDGVIANKPEPLFLMKGRE